MDDEALSFIAQTSGGDARRALNLLEAAALDAEAGKTKRIEVSRLRDLLQRKVLLYDKAGEEHYNLISALHKSMRESDPDATIYWLVRMLEAGEEPLYLARRIVRFASEDIGLADPRALRVALDAKEAFEFLGLPGGLARPGAGGRLLRARAEVERAVRGGERGQAGRRREARRAGALRDPQRRDEAHERGRLRQRGTATRTPSRRGSAGSSAFRSRSRAAATTARGPPEKRPSSRGGSRPSFRSGR